MKQTPLQTFARFRCSEIIQPQAKSDVWFTVCARDRTQLPFHDDFGIVTVTNLCKAHSGSLVNCSWIYQCTSNIFEIRARIRPVVKNTLPVTIPTVPLNSWRSWRQHHIPAISAILQRHARNRFPRKRGSRIRDRGSSMKPMDYCLLQQPNKKSKTKGNFRFIQSGSTIYGICSTVVNIYIHFKSGINNNKHSQGAYVASLCVDATGG